VNVGEARCCKMPAEKTVLGVFGKEDPLLSTVEILLKKNTETYKFHAFITNKRWLQKIAPICLTRSSFSYLQQIFGRDHKSLKSPH